MSVNADDLEVFILTKDRAALLEKTIESLLRQTLQGFSITVLDNASTDNTAEVVAAFKSPCIRISTAPENLGSLGNLHRSQMMATRKYVLIFHDDDQLHPDYLRTALVYLQAHSDAGLLVSAKRNIRAGANPDVPSRINRSAIKLNRSLFATCLFIQNKLAFSGVIYRTDCWKALDLESVFSPFGKWGDRSIMIEALGNRNAIVLRGPFIYYGRHETQDSRNEGTQTPYTAWLNRERLFKNILGDQLSTFPGLCFCIFSHRRLKSGYKRRIIKGLDFKAYIHDALEMGATTAKAWRFRMLAPRPVQNGFNSLAWLYLRYRYRIALPERD